MRAYEVTGLFASQLQRRIADADSKFKTKVVVTPSSVDERGVVIKIALLKIMTSDQTEAAKDTNMVRIMVQVSGCAESQTGLEQSCRAIEALNGYFKDAKHLRLEDAGGTALPGTRFVQKITPDDSFIDNPDRTTVQDVQDERIITIYYPEE